MKRKRFTEEQIISILREREAGMAVDDLSRRHGVSEQSTDPTAALRGYLTVFDGRRRGVIDAETPLAMENACHYRNQDIVLTRDWADERSDIAPVIRYFLEPRASHFAQPEEST